MFTLSDINKSKRNPFESEERLRDVREWVRNTIPYSGVDALGNSASAGERRCSLTTTALKRRQYDTNARPHRVGETFGSAKNITNEDRKYSPSRTLKSTHDGARSFRRTKSVKSNKTNLNTRARKKILQDYRKLVRARSSKRETSGDAPLTTEGANREIKSLDAIDNVAATVSGMANETKLLKNLDNNNLIANDESGGGAQRTVNENVAAMQQLFEKRPVEMNNIHSFGGNSAVAQPTIIHNNVRCGRENDRDYANEQRQQGVAASDEDEDEEDRTNDSTIDEEERYRRRERKKHYGRRHRRHDRAHSLNDNHASFIDGSERLRLQREPSPRSSLSPSTSSRGRDHDDDYDDHTTIDKDERAATTNDAEERTQTHEEERHRDDNDDDDDDNEGQCRREEKRDEGNEKDDASRLTTTTPIIDEIDDNNVTMVVATVAPTLPSTTMTTIDDLDLCDRCLVEKRAGGSSSDIDSRERELVAFMTSDSRHRQQRKYMIDVPGRRNSLFSSFIFAAKNALSGGGGSRVHDVEAQLDSDDVEISSSSYERSASIALPLPAPLQQQQYRFNDATAAERRDAIEVTTPVIDNNVILRENRLVQSSSGSNIGRYRSMIFENLTNIPANVGGGDGVGASNNVATHRSNVAVARSLHWSPETFAHPDLMQPIVVSSRDRRTNGSGGSSRFVLDDCAKKSTRKRSLYCQRRGSICGDGTKTRLATAATTMMDARAIIAAAADNDNKVEQQQQFKSPHSMKIPRDAETPMINSLISAAMLSSRRRCSMDSAGARRQRQTLRRESFVETTRMTVTGGGGGGGDGSSSSRINVECARDDKNCTNGDCGIVAVTRSRQQRDSSRAVDASAATAVQQDKSGAKTGAIDTVALAIVDVASTSGSDNGSAVAAAPTAIVNTFTERCYEKNLRNNSISSISGNKRYSRKNFTRVNNILDRDIKYTSIAVTGFNDNKKISNKDLVDYNTFINNDIDSYWDDVCGDEKESYCYDDEDEERGGRAYGVWVAFMVCITVMLFVVAIYCVTTFIDKIGNDRRSLQRQLWNRGEWPNSLEFKNGIGTIYTFNKDVNAPELLQRSVDGSPDLGEYTETQSSANGTYKYNFIQEYEKERNDQRSYSGRLVFLATTSDYDRIDEDVGKDGSSDDGRIAERRNGEDDGENAAAAAAGRGFGQYVANFVNAVTATAFGLS